MTTLLLNQLKHDIGRLRLLIAAFSAVALLKFFFILGYLVYPENTLPYQWSNISNQLEFLTFINYLIGSLVASTFIYQDSLCDPEAFWLSRPISPTAMFLSKALGVILICIGIPAASDLTIGLLLEHGSLSVLGTLPGIEVSLLIYIPVAFIASITKSQSRLIAIVTLLLVAFVTASFFFDSVLDINLHYQVHGLWKPILITSGLLGLLAATFNQYIRRHLSSSIAIAGITLSVCSIAPIFDLPEIGNTQPEKVISIDSEQIEVQAAPSYTESEIAHFPFETDAPFAPETIFIKIHIHGIPHDRIWLQRPQTIGHNGYLNPHQTKWLISHLNEPSIDPDELKEKDSFYVAVGKNYEHSNKAIDLSFYEYSLVPKGNAPPQPGLFLESATTQNIITDTEINKKSDTAYLKITRVIPPDFTSSIFGLPLSSKSKPNTYFYNPSFFSQKHEATINFPRKHEATPIYPFTTNSDYVSTPAEAGEIEVFEIILQNKYSLNLDIDTLRPPESAN